MIVIKIQGGIGNQLFQFALALALKKSNPEKKVRIDMTFYKYQDTEITKRKLYLKAFAIDEFEIHENTKLNLFFKIKNRLVSLRKKNIVTEKTKSYDSDIFHIKDPVYLSGYFQSYKYFENVNEVLRQQLVLNSDLTDKSNLYKQIIFSKPISISIHIRRGDYLTKYATTYNLLTIDYYQKAIATVKSKLGNLPVCVFIFSDDLDWCKENMLLNDETVFIENTNTPDYEDLLLMSYCSHNIIANSSYSWWSAWLNTNSNKIIVAPSQWYKQQEPDFINSIYPSTWNVL